MRIKVEMKLCGRKRTMATSASRDGVFELKGGAYSQHRGTGQTPTFKSKEQFRRWVRRNMFKSCG